MNLVTRRLRQISRDERGQMLILVAMLIVPISIALGAVAVDTTLWQSERRGAQKDADASALAGAWELLATDPSEVDATNAATEYADINDEADNADVYSIEVDASCFDGGDRLDSVKVRIRHQSRTFFGSAFGIDVPDIGAYARACAGSVISTTGLRPYGIESEPRCLSDGTCVASPDEDCFVFDPELGYNVPKFGEWCQLDDGSLDPSTSQRGLLDLEDSGQTCSDGGGRGQDIAENIRDGSGATCSIGDEVYSAPGAQPGIDLVQGMRQLLAGNGDPPVADGEDCDKRPWGNNSGIDDFDEVVERIDGGVGPSPDAVYQLRDCLSPRIINLIVVNHFPRTPSETGTVRAFASFYVLGCKLESEPTSVLPNRCESGAPGQLQLWGIFFQRVELGGDIGEFNPFGNNKIALVE
jgi:hypothetical protein